MEPLSSDTTMVLTAAESTKRSFGCGDSDDMTDFGKPLFRESKPHELGFPAALKQANRLIHEWAKELGSHSNPQMHAPTAIREQLQRWRGQ